MELGASSGVDLLKEWRRLLDCVGTDGLERKANALAGADALQVGLLVVGNEVVAHIQLCQRPDVAGMDGAQQYGQCTEV